VPCILLQNAFLFDLGIDITDIISIMYVSCITPQGKGRDTMTREQVETELIETYGWEPHDIEGYESEGMTHDDMLKMVKRTREEKTTRKTKGMLIEGTVTIERKGSSCQGCMPWETSYIDIIYNGKEYTWFSDRTERMHKGQILNIRAFAYGDRLRKVTIK